MGVIGVSIMQDVIEFIDETPSGDPNNIAHDPPHINTGVA